jgi:hypothetical protein
MTVTMSQTILGEEHFSGSILNSPINFTVPGPTTRVGPGPYMITPTDYGAACVTGGIVGGAFSLAGPAELSLGVGLAGGFGVGCVVGLIGAEASTESPALGDLVQYLDGANSLQDLWSDN